jgi:hypothetical protein
MAAVRLDGQTVYVKLPEGAEVPAEQGSLDLPPEWTRLYADGHLVE